MNDQIDEAQIAADFATLPDPVNGPMRRARALVEVHISEYGMVPHPDKIKEAIAVELGLAEIRGIDRMRDVAQSSIEQAKAYVDRAIASYVGDPAGNQFQKGFLAALEVVRDEAFSVSSTDRGGK